MRLTPAQLGIYALLGVRLHWHEADVPLADVVRGGHEMLVMCLGLDLGYDPREWHAYLLVFDDGGYRWCNKHEAFPSLIERALSDAEWQAAVEQLSGNRITAIPRMG